MTVSVEELLERIAIALETPKEGETALAALMQGMAQAQQEQLAVYRASAEANDLNWAKNHEANESSKQLTEAHHADCGAAHERYFKGLDHLAERIKALEAKAEPWQP